MNTMMQTLLFEELHAQMNNLHRQQHYVPSLQGSVYMGETIVFNKEVVLTAALCTMLKGGVGHPEGSTIWFPC
jgi:hypothetical protein